MAKWKLCRQIYGNDTFELKEGETISIGRGTQNNIILASLNISRKHCIITTKKDEVIIEDLKSANGIFVGLKKIPPNVPFSLSSNDIIGLGWTDGAPLAEVNDAEKFIFKLLKTTSDSSIIDRIQFQNENEKYDLPDENIHLSTKSEFKEESKPISALSLKRKLSTATQSHDEDCAVDTNIKNLSTNIIENCNELPDKKFKYSFKYEDEPVVKMENEDEQYEAFNIKQECFDDEVHIIDSDSDSEQWYFRLSQNSPRKSFSTFNESRISNDFQQNSSYSQLDDDVIFVKEEDKCKNESDEELYKDDLFTIFPQTVNIVDTTCNKSIETIDEVNNKTKNNLTPQLTNVCFDPTEKQQYLLSTSNGCMNVLEESTNNKIVVTGDKINRNNENSEMPKLKNNIDSTHEGEEIKNILSEKPLIDMVDGMSTNCTVKMANKINIVTNKLYDKNIKDTETKHILMSATDTKNLHKPTKMLFIDYKSQPNKNYSHSWKGRVKKKNDVKSRSSSCNTQITNSQKEERKKKLREIAAKDKGESELLCNSNLPRNEEYGPSTSKVNIKITASNRGAFLVDSRPLICKSGNKKKNKQQTNNTNKDNSLFIRDCEEQDNINTTKSAKDKEDQSKTKKDINDLKAIQSKHRTLSADSTTSTTPTNVADVEIPRRYSDNSAKDIDKTNNDAPISEMESENVTSKNLNKTSNSNIYQLKRKERISLEKSNISKKNSSIDDIKSSSNQKDTSANLKLQYRVQVPLQKNKSVPKSSIKTILKPMKENKEPQRKCDKRVTFSELQPEIHVFEIEQGNRMKKTSDVRSELLPTQHNIPVISVQKIALMKILRWNPQWLEEQNNFCQPPPILGHNNIPTAILHSFSSHTQYVELIGDLLLIEIWECLTQGFVKTRNVNTFLEMRIESLPLVPPHRSGLELMSLSVNVSVPTAQAHMIPREGEIMMFYFGENGKVCRFFFVHNVRCLPSPPNNVNSFYSISLQTSFTDKIRTLQRGSPVYGRSLAYIKKDLRLFEAMEYLSSSPLNEVLLNPQPRHFLLDEGDRSCTMKSQWSQPLNGSQKKAVMCAVSAARGERPRVHMIQGPPGTGKSRVICAIVMEYFYDAVGKKQKNRGKILLCATSNAAVDELVIRLLDIRQSLPHPERLKLVRVGRIEAMHSRARDISSLKLAQRDVARLQPDSALQTSSLSAEISLLEAKKNMWQTKAMSTDDDARKAYCLNRVTEIVKKIALFRSGGGGGGAGCGPEQLAHAERRVLEGADVVLTTLASAHSHKMRGVTGRIALCVIDEAGQAIEPETLVPLTLGVTRLALVGDPQQLPGFICSKRAKEHGLGESLFSRLSSCAETWGVGGPILLDRQYRMHPHIADYPNRAFYDGRVQNGTAHEQTLALDTAPYFVLGIITGDNGQVASGANDAEAWGAARVALALRSRLRTLVSTSSSSAAHSLAVITPYAAQRDLVRRHIRTLLQAEGGGGEDGEVEVNTVDSFQGQERSVVVVSLARSHGLGFLAAAGRMNVMLTRAKHVLVLCLNPRALEKNHQWRSLVEDAQRRKMYGTLPIDMCRHPSQQHVSHQQILQFLSRNPPANVTRKEPHQSFVRGSSRNYRSRRN